jgi:D-3-phosphoglycerate dehydrogenase
LLHDVAAADAIIVRSATKVDAEVIAAGTSLKAIVRAGVGVDTIDLGAAARRGVVVMNAPDATTTSVAEITIGCLVALARQICAADHSMKSGEWAKKRFMGTELAGRTLGVVGCGRIGQRVARIASAMGMTVVAADPRPLPPDCPASAVTLDALCDCADYISLHAPVTASTRRLFGEARLARCRAGVRLVNTSRGELIDEKALLEALERGHVAGAALDVYDPEPPVDFALARHPAVIATPHIAASTAEAQERVGLEAAIAVRDYLTTGVARHLVGPPADEHPSQT